MKAKRKKTKTAADWLKSYYPFPPHRTTPRTAGAHCRRKWSGLRPAILREHGLKRDECTIQTEAGADVLDITDATCAYRLHHFHNLCAQCPLCRVRGMSCVDETDYETLSPYEAFTEHGDPEPMIAWLAVAGLYEKQEG